MVVYSDNEERWRKNCFLEGSNGELEDYGCDSFANEFGVLWGWGLLAYFHMSGSG